ncbi:MAG: class I SAM-dependent methyltransferase [Mycobacteriales bacterium]
MSPDAVRASYDRVAERYAVEIAGELAHKPLDRALLTAFAEQVGAGQRIADVGCGPGHVAAFLAGCGADVVGIDLSPEMVRVASARQPELTFRVGDMRHLDEPSSAFAGVVAFYSVIHLTRDELPLALAEFHRVLTPDGLLLLAFHLGDEVRHTDEWWGETVDLDFRFLPRDHIDAVLDDAGFAIELAAERTPYRPLAAAAEVQTRRCYLLARRG